MISTAFAIVAMCQHSVSAGCRAYTTVAVYLRMQGFAQLVCICNTSLTMLVCIAAAQAGLLPGPYGGFGAGGFGLPFMQPQYPMAAPMLEGSLLGQGADFDYSNGMGYGKDSAQLRRDRARGRHMPY